MPDYRYLRPDPNQGKKTQDLAVQLFSQDRDKMIEILIANCKEKIEYEVRRFYELGAKKYSQSYPFTGSPPPISKTGWFSHDYKMVYYGYSYGDRP